MNRNTLVMLYIFDSLNELHWHYYAVHMFFITSRSIQTKTLGKLLILLWGFIFSALLMKSSSGKTGTTE